MNTTPPTTPQQRNRLDRFDDLLDTYGMTGATSAVEHPLHDALGDIGAAVDRPMRDSAASRRLMATIQSDIVRRRVAAAAEARRLPAWLNAGGTFNDPQGETT